MHVGDVVSCPICKKQGLLYPCNGFLTSPGGMCDDENPESEISEACADCIDAEKVARIEEYEFVDYLKGRYKDGVHFRDGLRRTPQLPLLMQREDWAFCCNDLCEFVGSPATYEELLVIVGSCHYWDRIRENRPRDFRRDGPPESLNEISAFRCLHCPKRFWIDQFT